MMKFDLSDSLTHWSKLKSIAESSRDSAKCGSCNMQRPISFNVTHYNRGIFAHPCFSPFSTDFHLQLNIEHITFNHNLIPDSTAFKPL